MSMRKIIRQVAHKNGVRPAEVKRDMQAVIDHTYRNTPNDGLTFAYQKQVPHKGDIPSIEEFVSFAAKKVKSGVYPQKK